MRVSVSYMMIHEEACEHKKRPGKKDKKLPSMWNDAGPTIYPAPSCLPERIKQRENAKKKTNVGFAVLCCVPYPTESTPVYSKKKINVNMIDEKERAPMSSPKTLESKTHKSQPYLACLPLAVQRLRDSRGNSFITTVALAITAQTAPTLLSIASSRDSTSICRLRLLSSLLTHSNLTGWDRRTNSLRVYTKTQGVMIDLCSQISTSGFSELLGKIGFVI